MSLFIPQEGIKTELEGGYYFGPLYALVSVATMIDRHESWFNYAPLNVTYDFQAGLRWKGFDVHVSRWCTHNVTGRLPTGGDLRLVMSYSTWRNR
jgi:hypothetical protein